ncbi:MAG: YraN family protein [Clostridia bacterium]|nr:YraN family protein [Clostridia bacterium]
MNRGTTGKKGEDMTARFLRKRGFAVVLRNYRCRFGEIDIIAETDEYIIFVEVKTRGGNCIGRPAEAVDAAKQQRIILTAEDYISKSGCKLQPRFDVAEVTVLERQDGAVGYSLNYIENAF